MKTMLNNEYKQSPAQSVEAFASEINDYLNTKKDSTKLAITENMSVLLSTTFGLLLAVLLGINVLLFLAIALLFALGVVVGYGIAAVIIAGVFMILAIVVYSIRKKIILSPLIKTFIKLFYNRPTHNQSENV